MDLGGGVNDLDASRENEDVQGEFDEGKASAMGGGADGVVPSEYGALPRHKWHPHTVKVGKEDRVTP